MDFSDDEEEEGPKSNHPLDADDIKERMWDSVKWTYLLPFCERFKLISKEQEETLVKIGRSPEIVFAEIVKAVKQQGEEGYQKFRQAMDVGSKENAKKLEPIAHIYKRLPDTLPPEKQAEPQDAATLQRNWLIRHFKSMGKIDHTSIHFSSMLVDVSKCMDLDIEAAGIFCLQSMKMIDGSPLFTGMYMREADTPDNLFISMERNKLLHSRDGDVMEKLCLDMDRPDLLRYISEFHSKVEIIPAEPEGVKLYLNDRFIVRTLVHNKRNLTFDDVLRVKAIISEHYKIGKHIFQFRGWMKGANSSAIIFWQFPYVYVDYLMKVILEKVDDLVHRDIYRIELHMSPDSYEDVTVYDLQHIYFHRLKEDFKRQHADYLAKKKAEDDKKDDGDASAGGKDGGGPTSSKDTTNSTSQPQTRSKTASKKTAENSKVTTSSSPTSSKRSFDGTPRDDPSWKSKTQPSKKMRLACVSNSLLEQLHCF